MHQRSSNHWECRNLQIPVYGTETRVAREGDWEHPCVAISKSRSTGLKHVAVVGRGDALEGVAISKSRSTGLKRALDYEAKAAQQRRNLQIPVYGTETFATESRGMGRGGRNLQIPVYGTETLRHIKQEKSGIGRNLQIPVYGTETPSS